MPLRIEEAIDVRATTKLKSDQMSEYGEARRHLGPEDSKLVQYESGMMSEEKYVDDRYWKQTTIRFSNGNGLVYKAGQVVDNYNYASLEFQVGENLVMIDDIPPEYQILLSDNGFLINPTDLGPKAQLYVVARNKDNRLVQHEVNLTDVDNIVFDTDGSIKFKVMGTNASVKHFDIDMNSKIDFSNPHFEDGWEFVDVNEIEAIQRELESTKHLPMDKQSTPFRKEHSASAEDYSAKDESNSDDDWEFVDHELKYGGVTSISAKPGLPKSAPVQKEALPEPDEDTTPVEKDILPESDGYFRDLSFLPDIK